MPTHWRLTKKAKRIMSLLGSLTGSLIGSGAQGAIANTAQAQIAPGAITQGQAWNAIQQRDALMNSYPYTNTSYRALHLVVKQVENGYTVEIGGSTHIASDLKEITDLLTNRVAATLLEWNP